MENTGHLVERAGEDADLIRGLYRKFTVKIAGGDLFRPGGQPLDGVHHGFGEEETQQDGDEQTDHQGLQDDHCLLYTSPHGEAQLGCGAQGLKDADMDAVGGADL